MVRAALCAASLACLIGAAAEARPVSYEGGWTVIEKTDRQSTNLWVHYTPHPRLSLGPRTLWDRREDILFQGVQATGLIHRWFGQDYQANLYGFVAPGGVTTLGEDDKEREPAVFAGIMADWETRRFYLSYRFQALEAGDVDASAAQAARVGVAPYIGDYGDLHTWFMVEIDHRADNEEPVGVTPLVRFFKGSALLELGVSVTDDTPQPLANFTYRF